MTLYRIEPLSEDDLPQVISIEKDPEIESVNLPKIYDESALLQVARNGKLSSAECDQYIYVVREELEAIS
jgi:hypothetical protein